MKRKPVTTGIVGGAGPMAGVLLSKLFFKRCQRKYGCINDYDFPRFILLSTPFDEMLKPGTNDQKEGSVKGQLKDSIEQLEKSGAKHIGIACQTLHGFLDKSTPTKTLVHIVDVVKSYIEEKNFSRILILCSKTSVEKNVHDFPRGCYPTQEEQIVVDTVIRRVLAGEESIKESRTLQEEISYDGIDAVLLGCTELSVLHESYPVNISGVEVIDPLEILSNQLCDRSFNIGEVV